MIAELVLLYLVCNITMSTESLICNRGHVEYENRTETYLGLDMLSERNSTSGNCLTICFKNKSSKEKPFYFFLNVAFSNNQCLNKEETCRGASSSDLECVGVDCCNTSHCNKGSNAECNPVQDLSPTDALNSTNINPANQNNTGKPSNDSIEYANTTEHATTPEQKTTPEQETTPEKENPAGDPAISSHAEILSPSQLVLSLVFLLVVMYRCKQ